MRFPRKTLVRRFPKILVDSRRMRKISREIKGFCVPDEEESARDEAVSQRRPGQPEVLVRSVVATREDVHAFGKQLAAAAWQRGFAAAPRKAFVGRRTGCELDGVAHATSPITRRSWISSTRSVTCLPPQWRDGPCVRDGRSIASGRNGCGAERWNG